MTGRWGTRTVPGEEVSTPAAVAGAGGGRIPSSAHPVASPGGS